VAFLLFGGLLYRLNELRVLRRHVGDDALTERPEGLEEYPVEIVIRLNEKPLGLDRGVVYFDRSLIGFVGSSASFLLAEEDLAVPKTGILTDFDVPFRKIKLNAAGGKADIQIRPLLGYGRAYRTALRRFLHDRTATDELRQWPPLVEYAPPPKPEVVRDEPDKLPLMGESSDRSSHDLLYQAELALRHGERSATHRLQDRG
jgi:hypothetical protein